MQKFDIRRISFWPRFISFLILIPVASFLGRQLTTILAVGALTALLSRQSSLTRKVRRQLTRYLIPLAVGLLALHAIFEPGGTQSILLSWALTVARFTVLIGFGLLFSQTTNPLELPKAAQQLGVPVRYGIGLLVAYRLVPLLSERISTIMLSQRSRGAQWNLSPAGVRQLPRLLVSLAVPAVYAALELALALSDSLFIRGFRPNSSPAPAPTGESQWLLDMIVLFLGLIVASCAALERSI